MHSRCLALLGAVLFGATLGGCGSVYSRAPASDDATSRFDASLVGFWRVDEDATPGSKEDPLRSESIVVVGRKRGSETGLEVMTVAIRHGKRNDQTIDTTRNDLAVTTIADKGYASVSLSKVHVGYADGARETLDAGSKEEAGWMLLRYDMPDADTLRVLALEEKSVAADVRASKVAGRVEESDAQGGKPSTTVTLEASTAVLRAYLQQRADGIFRVDRPLVLKRLRVR